MCIDIYIYILYMYISVHVHTVVLSSYGHAIVTFSYIVSSLYHSNIRILPLYPTEL